MNLILFDKPFEQLRLEPGDPRGQHIRKVLRAELGTKVFIGFVQAERARALHPALFAQDPLYSPHLPRKVLYELLE
jgi:hypothetical protein